MNKNLVVGLVIGGTSAAASGLVWLGSKIERLVKKIGMSLDELAKSESNDISEALIERSVERAAQRRVDAFARDVDAKAMSEMKSEIRKEAKKAVESAFEDAKNAVEHEIASQVAALDHQALRKAVIEDAKRATMQKLDGSLDDILKGFSDDLDRVKKIHTSIAEALSRDKDPGRELTFRVG